MINLKTPEEIFGYKWLLDHPDAIVDVEIIDTAWAEAQALGIEDYAEYKQFKLENSKTKADVFADLAKQKHCLKDFNASVADIKKNDIKNVSFETDKDKNKVTENMHKEVFRFYGKDKQGDEIEYKIDGVSFTDAIEVFVRMYPDVEDWDVETLKEAVDFTNVQWGVHQFSTESIIFRGTEEECQRYIDDRPELWDDAEVYFMTPDDPHYIKSEEKQPLTEAGEEKVYQVIVKYKDEPAQKLEARTAKNRKELEYQLSTDPDVEWYDFDEKQFNEDKDEKQICCICGKEYIGYGNNAEPVKAGRCCDDCNINQVIPARLLKINVSENKSMTEIFQNLSKIKK